MEISKYILEIVGPGSDMLQIISVMLLFPFMIYGWQIYAYMVLQDSFAGVIPTATFAAAPGVMKKQSWLV